jgi:hypothetical protein
MQAGASVQHVQRGVFWVNPTPPHPQKNVELVGAVRVGDYAAAAAAAAAQDLPPSAAASPTSEMPRLVDTTPLSGRGIEVLRRYQQHLSIHSNPSIDLQ